MTQPLQPAERPDLTKSELAAARTVFLRRGFAGASFDEIAEEAGCSKHAIETSFPGKYELFLAAFEDHFRDRSQGYAEAMFGHENIEDGYRALARYWREETERDLEWARLLTEIIIHASRDQALSASVQAGRQMGMQRMAEMFDSLAAEHGIEFTRPTIEIVLASGALNRGLAMEQLLSPDLPEELFEEMNVAFMRGLTKRP